MDFSLYSMVVEELMGELKEKEIPQQDIVDAAPSMTTEGSMLSRIFSDKGQFFKHTLFATIFAVAMIFLFKNFNGQPAF